MKENKQYYFLRIALVLSLFITAVIIHSCKKDNSFVSTTNKTAVEIKQWITLQKTDTLSAISINSLLTQIDWNNAHTLSADSGKTYDIAPLTTTATFDDKGITQQRYIVLLKQNNKITAGNIYELFGDKTDITGKADNLIASYEQKSIPGFNGNIAFYSWNNSIKASKNYVNGIITSVAVVNARSSGNNETLSTGKKTNTSSCTDWYWETYMNGVLISSQYLYTTCTGSGDGVPCPVNAIRDGKGTMSVKINCSGGSGGNPSSGTGPDTTNTDPCKQIATINARQANAIIANQNSQLFNTLSTSPYEYGADENLASWSTAPNTFMSTQVRTDSKVDAITSNFTWDSTNGYNIGFAHDHPDATGPSPEDIFKMLINSKSSTLTNAGASAVSFYKNNAFVSVVTNDNTYVVTIKNWTILNDLYGQYQNNPAAFDQNVVDINNNTGSYEVAILKIFSSAINLYTASPNSNDYTALTVGSDNHSTGINCPGK